LPLIIYNNVMDDLDGVLAAKLNIRSAFGAHLDNVCDAIAHTIFVFVVGMHFAQNASHPSVHWICLASSVLAITAIILRVVSRIDATSPNGMGSPTNELIRHVFFVLLVAPILGLNPVPFFVATCTLHAVSMLVPFKMPYLIRSRARSTTSITVVNIVLVVAWSLPFCAPIVAASFVLTYLGSFVVAGIGWLLDGTH